MISKLNGWQRGWVVVCALGLVCALGTLAVGWYSMYESSSSRIDNTITYGLRSLEDINSDAVKNAWTDEEATQRRQRLTENIAAARSDLLGRYRKDVSLLIGLVSLIWVGASLSLYIIGWAVAWVIQGFRRE